MSHKLFPAIVFALFALLGAPGSVLFAQTTAFTYQGWLTEGGSPANGNHEFQFRLTEEDGTAVGEPVTRSDVPVLGGAFTVSLDFGLDVFDGSDRWLEISVRSNPENAFTLLQPRQRVTAAPYAIRAATAAAVTGSVDAGQISGTIAPSVIAPGSITSEMLADGSVGTAQLAPGSFYNGYFEGSAWNATNLRTRELQDEVLVGWTNTSASSSIPSAMSDLVAIAGGFTHVFGIRRNGSVVGWNGASIIEPEGFTDIVRIAITETHLLGLRSNGTVVTWGTSNDSGRLTVPVGLSNVVGVAAGGEHSLALVQGGTVVGWGVAPARSVPQDLPPAVAIAAGGVGLSSFSLALLADGTVRGWGANGAATPPPGLSNVVAIAAGDSHSLALRSDGTVVAWGGQTTTPPGLADVLEIATADNQNIALKRDGSVVYWQGTTVIATAPAELPPASLVAVTGSRGFALVAQPSQLARLNGSNTFSAANTFSGNNAFSGSNTFSQSNTFSADNTFTGGLNTFTGNLRVNGVIRSGTETGTTDPPNPAGMITRRVNSSTTTSGAVVAIAALPSVSTFQLQRDGTAGGFRVSYPAGSQLSVAAMGIDHTGAARNFHQVIAAPAEAGFVQVYTNASNVVHFQITFGDMTFNRHVTTVTLTRTPGGSSWYGHMVSNTSQ